MPPQRRGTYGRTATDEFNRLVAGTFGLGFLLAGVLGFVAGDGSRPFAGDAGYLLLGLRVNDLHNVVHLVIGAALVTGAATGYRAARTANLVVGLVYLVLGIVGLFVMGTDVDVIALNAADNGLHLVSGALLVLSALVGWSRRAR